MASVDVRSAVRPDQPIASAEIGLWMFLATVLMLFAGFSSAYLVRQTTGGDWRPAPLPPILWLNTGVLLASSVVLERGRARLGVRSGPGAPPGWSPAAPWVRLAGLLGLIFVAGQVAAWRRLVADGITLAAGPFGAFFYILSGAHAAHVTGGLAAIGAVMVSLRRGAARAPDRLRLCATYWHFMGALWIYLLVLLVVFS